jgi:hypothetical protein
VPFRMVFLRFVQFAKACLRNPPYSQIGRNTYKEMDTNA